MGGGQPRRREGRADVSIDPGLVLAAGHSGGASSAPWIASNEQRFTAFAVLHGGVVEGGIGDHVVPGWFSTGESDTVRPPEHVQGAMEYMEGLGFDELSLHLYPGGHGLIDEELDGLIAWWLQ
jgi:predicted esterase